MENKRHTNGVRFRSMMEEGNRFILAVEVETSRGLLTETSAQKAQSLAYNLMEAGIADIVCMTDNPGGNPHNRPETLAMTLMEKGWDTVVNISCKDYNRNAVEGRLWMLASLGFVNILALSGDYPSDGLNGNAQPVFDIDSVSLLDIIRRMNMGLQVKRRNEIHKLQPTNFFAGAAVNPFKKLEGELLTQYFKFALKVKTNAAWGVTQIGYDSRKLEEFSIWAGTNGCTVPMMGSVFVLSKPAAEFFNRWGIPGVALTDDLLSLAEKHSRSSDKGQQFFNEFAAKQIAILQGLGFRGAYLSGRPGLKRIEKIVGMARSFSGKDWQDFADEIVFPQNEEFYLFQQGDRRGRSSNLINPEYTASKSRGNTISRIFSNPSYTIGHTAHSVLFSTNAPAFNIGKKVYALLENSKHSGKIAHAVEQAIKIPIYNCKDCGDCSLPDIAYLCPESQCVKNQRNGPCGGTKAGKCEVLDKECIWLRAYNRLKPFGKEEDMLERRPVFKDGALQGSSAWANAFLGHDHNAQNNEKNTT